MRTFTIATVRLLRVLSAALVLTAALSAAPAQASNRGINGRIVFTANLKGRSWELYTMRPDGSDRRKLTKTGSQDTSSYSPDYSPDGTMIAFHAPSDSGDYAIWTVNADGSGLRQVTHDPGHTELWPNWSPDGSKLLFSRTDRYGYVQIVVINADGSGDMKILTTGRNDGFMPMWTPDGAQIVFGSARKGQTSAVWIMNADGSNPRQLTATAMMASPWDISPDGTRIVITDNQNTAFLPTSIYLIDLDGSNLTPLTHQEYHHDVGPHFSPDGSQIAFVSDRNFGGNCCYEAFVMNADGSNVHVITSNLTVPGCPQPPSGNCAHPAWGVKP
jgi:Tol biopolymer transport system component